MLEIVLRWTNRKTERENAKYKNIFCSELVDLDMVELKVFLGLLYFTSIFMSNHEKIERIYATDGSGREIFRWVMSKNRFAFLHVCLRFDNPDDRNIRKLNDPTAAISELFNNLVTNSQTMYTLGVNVAIDEMLVAFRGLKCRCPITRVNTGSKLSA